MTADLAGAHQKTIGADKSYDTKGFVAEMRRIGVTPHVAQNTGAPVVQLSMAAPPATRAMLRDDKQLWPIKNSWRRSRIVSLREDTQRSSEFHSVQNLAWLRRLAFNAPRLDGMGQLNEGIASPTQNDRRLHIPLGWWTSGEPPEQSDVE
jgi:hypothetical protein